MESSFNVRIHAIQTNKRAKGNSYTVRWKVETEPFSKTYATRALADSRRSELIAAQRKGEAFNLKTGLPSSLATKAAEVNWYDFAIEYADMKWPQSSGNSRKNTAKALTTATIALLRIPIPKEFDPVKVRTALREWAFNSKRRSEAPDDVRVILGWIQRNTLPMSAWEDPDRTDEVVQALVSRDPVRVSSSCY